MYSRARFSTTGGRETQFEDQTVDDSDSEDDQDGHDHDDNANEDDDEEDSA